MCNLFGLTKGQAVDRDVLAIGLSNESAFGFGAFVSRGALATYAIGGAYRGCRFATRCSRQLVKLSFFEGADGTQVLQL